MAEHKPGTSFHRTVSDLLDPHLRISVALVGAGGTGSFILENLAHLHQTMVALNGTGLFVTVYDNDQVELHNVGRQRFSYPQVGLNKAHALVADVNRKYCLDWKAQPNLFNVKDNILWGNFLITAVDSGKLRNQIAAKLKRNKIGTLVSGNRDGDHGSFFRNYYWIDCGNDQRLGQVILGGQGLPNAVEVCGKFDETEGLPSCSAAESLTRQDLYINRFMADIASHMLWTMLRRGMIDYHGVYLNLETMTMRRKPVPIPVTNGIT